MVPVVCNGPAGLFRPPPGQRQPYFFFLVARFFFLAPFFLAAFFLVAFFLAAFLFFLATVHPPYRVHGEIRLDFAF